MSERGSAFSRTVVTMANAMVIGIGGVGSVIGQKLHEFDCFDQIVLADLDPAFAHQLASRMPKHRFVVVEANAMDIERLTSLMNEYSVAVTCNACICQTNHSVLEACLRAGSQYIDMAADIYSPPESSGLVRTRSRPRSKNSTMRISTAASPAFSAWAWIPAR